MGQVCGGIDIAKTGELQSIPAFQAIHCVYAVLCPLNTKVSLPPTTEQQVIGQITDCMKGEGQQVVDRMIPAALDNDAFHSVKSG